MGWRTVLSRLLEEATGLAVWRLYQGNGEGRTFRMGCSSFNEPAPGCWSSNWSMNSGAPSVASVTGSGSKEKAWGCWEASRRVGDVYVCACESMISQNVHSFPALRSLLLSSSRLWNRSFRLRSLNWQISPRFCVFDRTDNIRLWL